MINPRPSSFKFVLVCLLFVYATTLDTQKVTMDDLLLWGTYKPHLYSAITQRSRHPISVGLAFRQKSTSAWGYMATQSLRYRMRRESNSQYEYHNGFDFSIQNIEDKELCATFRITFIKNVTGNNDTILQEWHYLIETERSLSCSNTIEIGEEDPIKELDTYIYVGLENLEPEIQDDRYIEYLERNESSTLMRVIDKLELGPGGYLRVTHLDNEGKLNTSHIFNCYTSDIDKTKIWKVEDHITSFLGDNSLEGMTTLDTTRCPYNSSNNDSTLFLSQAIGKPGFRILVSFNSHEAPKDISIEELHLESQKRKENFETLLEEKFPLKSVNKYKFDRTEAKEIVRYALSNLLGGILYSFGKIRIQGKNDDEIPRLELFTASPSRVGFPRGFLWDEGFHQTVICKYNTSLCMRMMQTWLNTIQENGWIPREQARGEELEGNFQQISFLYQSEEEANPPSMIIPVLGLLDKYFRNTTSDVEKAEIFEFFWRNRGKYKKWLEWFVNTQKNNDAKDVLKLNNASFYRWSCKSPCNGRYMASGLDDYPRHPPYMTATGHIDLLSWMTIFTHGVMLVDKVFNETDPVLDQQLNSTLSTIVLHLDQETGIFKDVNEYGRRKWYRPETAPEEEEQLPPTRTLSPHLGYVNIFPLFFGLIPAASREFNATIELIGSRKHLWSDFGVRSLSTEDDEFQRRECYWTEPIWIPMNYLLLRGLRYSYYYNQDARDLYQALRNNIMENMSATWKKTHNFWENYDSFDGRGKGFPYFTGWTSLVILIYSEQY